MNKNKNAIRYEELISKEQFDERHWGVSISRLHTALDHDPAINDVKPIQYDPSDSGIVV